MRPRRTKVSQKLMVLRAAGVEKGVAEHGQAALVEVARREQSVLVGGLGELHDQTTLPVEQGSRQGR
jgi:hypothetical protein